MALASSIRRPVFAVTLNTKLEALGLVALDQRLLLVGARLSTGTVLEEVPTRVKQSSEGDTFFGIGSVRSRWSPKTWWRAGLETLVIGMVAASVAYVIGSWLKEFV